MTLNICNREGTEVIDFYGGSKLMKAATDFQHH